MIVYTMTVNAEQLTETSIAIVNGQARYLRRLVPDVVPYLAWEYTTHLANGEIFSRGTMHVRRDSLVTVVCVTLDGSVVTP